MGFVQGKRDHKFVPAIAVSEGLEGDSVQCDRRLRRTRQDGPECLTLRPETLAY